MDVKEIEDENNASESDTEDHLLDIICCITVIYFDHVFRSHCLYPPISNMSALHMIFVLKIYECPIQRFYSLPFYHFFMN